MYLLSHTVLRVRNLTVAIWVALAWVLHGLWLGYHMKLQSFEAFPGIGGPASRMAPSQGCWLEALVSHVCQRVTSVPGHVGLSKELLRTWQLASHRVSELREKARREPHYL